MNNYDLYELKYQNEKFEEDLALLDILAEENDFVHDNEYHLDEDDYSSIDSNHPDHKNNDYPTSPESQRSLTSNSEEDMK